MLCPIPTDGTFRSEWLHAALTQADWAPYVPTSGASPVGLAGRGSVCEQSERWWRNIRGHGYLLVKADKGQMVTVTVTAHRYGWTSGSVTTASDTVH